MGAFAIAYVAFASLRLSGGQGLGAVALVALPLLLAFGWSKTKPPARGEDPIDPAVRGSMRAALFGGAMLLAARTSFVDDGTLEAAANLGTGFAAVAALVALARIEGPGGALPVPKAARRLDAAWLVGLVWGGASLLALGSALAPDLVIEPRQARQLGLFAGNLSFLVSLLAAARVHLLRRLELGTGDRTRVALRSMAIALVVSATAALVDLSPPGWAFQAGTAASSVVLVLGCMARDPVEVARAHRVLVAVAIAGAPLTMLAASVALRAPALAGAAVLFAAMASIAIGLFARIAVQPIERDSARWLATLERASLSILDTHPDRAAPAALHTLRDAAGQPELPPSLFCLGRDEVFTTDHAGYLHIRKARLPDSVLKAALDEPERTLRLEVLEEVEVRRPDLRPALSFMRDEGAFTATLLVADGEVVGALLLAKGRRTSPLTLEEARALGLLSERLATVLETSARLARAEARELAERARADAEDDRARHLAYLLEAAGARYETDARRLARPALAAAYSPASRLLLEELSRKGALGMPIALLAPLGIDPVPYAAVAHLSGLRRTNPFVVIDGANPAEQPLAVWEDAVSSPLATADSGTLVVSSVEALPHETQSFLALALATRSSPRRRATPLDVGLVVSVMEPLDELVASGRLVPELANRLGEAPLALPRLVERAEDLRSLSLDRLGRIGVRLRGRPMGIDARAMARLVEHSWPGNELELDDVLSRAAAVAERDVVGAEDLERIGFVVVGVEEVLKNSRAASWQGDSRGR